MWREAAAVEPAVRFTGECFLTATRDPAAIRRGLETFYRDETRRLTAAMLASHAPRVGVTYGRVAVTGARRRFGSCGRTGNLNFSWRLALYPEPLIELVVLHELVHRVEMNHSPAFYKVLSRHLPDHRERRRALLEWSRKLCLYPE